MLITGSNDHNSKVNDGIEIRLWCIYLCNRQYFFFFGDYKNQILCEKMNESINGKIVRLLGTLCTCSNRVLAACVKADKI